ncbi:DUF2975 domain-containing protein [Auraticoccus monumenti]|uniref:DUF2975 domain-containing protein n=1 Tax=Auraticoccus monumenti TaxID=675864 RepID=A0A1G7C3K2_9ACTN|nr:DUF2975 domain-containing protein [Auraticoccus monumenti]SDE33954.1 Protein of unknown function [Auraticoccus monumenti]
MRQLVVIALRLVIALGVAGALVVQVAVVWALARDAEDGPGELSHLRFPIMAVVVLGLLCVQVTLVCIWRLLTLVRRGTVFSHAAFRFVDVVIGAAVVAALLTLALGVLLAPGEAVAPGIVLLIGGLSLAAAGTALLVFVMRTLLAQAVARDTEALHLRAELDEVI